MRDLTVSPSSPRLPKPVFLGRWLGPFDQKGNSVPQYIADLPQGSTTPQEWLAGHGHLKVETKQ
jgi:hypothetical protein